MPKIVRENGTIRARIISPGHGSTGYYSPALLEKSAPKFEGVQAYWDHPTSVEESTRPERSLRDLAGKVSNSKWEAAGKEGPGIYADVAVFKPFQESVEELGPHMGMSIRASGRGKAGKVDGKEAMIVESIDKVQSVDFVTLPGRGGKVLQMFESAREAGRAVTTQENEMDEVAIKKLIESGVAAGVAAEMAKLQKPVSALEARALRGDAVVLATKTMSGLALAEASKQRVIDNVLRGELPMKEGALDETAFQALVTNEAKAEATYVSTLTGRGNVVGMGTAHVEVSEADAKRIKEAKEQELKESQDAFSAFGLPKGVAELAATGRYGGTN